MAGFASGKLSVENVDLDSSQTLENKVLDASNDFSGDIIDPSRSDVKQGTQAELEAYASGASNGQMCFATDTKQMYQVLDGALAAVGGGSGGLDTFFTDTFEVAGVSDYTSGNDAIFDNGGVLAGALADETVNNISGDQSLKYTQAAGSLNDFIKSPLIPIGKKQQGNTVGLELFYTYSGNSDDLKIVGYDDTGSEVMTLSSNLIKASSKAQRLSVQFPVPSGSANLAWGIQVVVENDGAVLVVDDVQISTNPYVSKDLLDNQEYRIVQNGSSFTNLVAEVEFNLATATITNSNSALLVAEDDSANTRTKFVSTRDGVVVDISWYCQVDTANRTAQIYKNGVLHMEGGIGDSAIANVEVGVSGTMVLNTGEYFTVATGASLRNVAAPYILNFTATAATEHIVAYNSRNAENSMIRLHTGNGHGSVNNKIRRFSTTVADLGNAITYTDSATDGASFTINEDGVYFMNYNDVLSSSSENIGFSLNSTELTTAIGSLITVEDRLNYVTSASAAFSGSTSWSGKLKRGDIIRAHTGGNANATTRASFTITKIGVGDLLGVPVPRTAYIKDVKPSGTAGGTFTSGAWQTRDLNTLEGDTEFVSLSSNQVTLESGKYEIEASAPALRVADHKIILRNITDSTDDLIGTSAYNAVADLTQTVSSMVGTLTITSSKTFEVQHRGIATQSNNGFGEPSVFGVDEIYTTLKITKVS
jgi:hypothetical protein